MTAVRSSPTQTVREASPPPVDRQLRPMPHRTASATSAVRVTPPPRPQLTSRPSLSAFVSDSVRRTGYKYAVEGNCVSCMAAMRDAYDKMHAEHLASEQAETYKATPAPKSGAGGKQHP